jgi:hypothetical protein
VGESIFLIMFLGGVGLLVAVRARRLRRQGFRPSVKRPWARPDHKFDAVASSTFLGGANVGRHGAPPPLVRLRVDERWARLRGGCSAWIDRTVVVRVEDITAILSTGVRFATEDGRYDGIVFWTNEVPEVLAAFRHHGWPVEISKPDRS